MLSSKEWLQLRWLACLYSPGPGIEGGRRGHGLGEEVFDHRAHQTCQPHQCHGKPDWLGKPRPTNKMYLKYTQTLLSLLEPEKKTTQTIPNTPKPGSPFILETFPQGPWSIAHAEQIAVLMPWGRCGAIGEAPTRSFFGPSCRFLHQKMGGWFGWLTKRLSKSLVAPWILTIFDIPYPIFNLLRNQKKRINKGRHRSLIHGELIMT